MYLIFYDFKCLIIITIHTYILFIHDPNFKNEKTKSTSSMKYKKLGYGCSGFWNVDAAAFIREFKGSSLV